MDDDDHQDNGDSIHDIIDPNEFFAAAEGNDVEDSEIEDEWDELDQDDLQGLPVPTLDVQIDLYYRDILKPLINRFNSDRWDLDPIETIRIAEAELWLLLTRRERCRREFVEAIKYEAKKENSRLKFLHIYWNLDLFDDEEGPWDDLRRCVEDLGSAFSVCTKLKNVSIHLVYRSNFETMDEIAGTMLQRLEHQVQSLHLYCNRQRNDPMPDPFVRVVSALPHLQQLALITGQGNVAALVCELVAGKQSLESFELACFSARPMPLDMHAAAGVAQLLRSTTLKSFTLGGSRFADDAAAGVICDALVASSGLKSVILYRLYFDEDTEGSDILFFRRLGYALPAMKNISELNVSFDNEEQGTPSSEDCLDALLAGVAMAPKIRTLCLQGFAWTSRLAQAIAGCLPSCKSLDFLHFGRTFIGPDNELVLSVLGPALEMCLLRTFSCEFRGNISAAAVDIAKSLGRNRSIGSFVLVSDSRVPVEAVSEIFVSFRNNMSLTRLSLSLELDKVQDEGQFSELLTAIEANVIVERISFSPFGGSLSGDQLTILADCIATTCELNRLGRRYIRAPNDSNFAHHAVQVLSGADCLNSVYTHLHEIPTLFRRRHDDDAPSDK